MCITLPHAVQVLSRVLIYLFKMKIVHEVHTQSKMIKKLVSRIKKLCSVKWPVTILGDLNCPDVNWSKFTSPCNGIQDKIFDCFCEPGMTQLLNSVTCNDHILDLVLTNDWNERLIYSEIHVDEPFCNTVWFCIVDHRVVNPVSHNSMSTTYCWKSITLMA